MDPGEKLWNKRERERERERLRERKRNLRQSTTQIEDRQPYKFPAKNQIKLGSIHNSISCVQVGRGSDLV